MKKAFSLFSIIAMLCAGTLFTSCTKDEILSNRLSGEWHGTWNMWYEYQYSNGVIERYDSYDTYIVFDPRGYGYQVDWYYDGPYERLSYKFYWSINNGVIHLTYPGYHDYDADIYRYHLDYDYFTGRFSVEGEEFRLHKLANFTWDDYYPYDFCEWGWSYSVKTRSNAENDSISTPVADGKVIKIGCGLAEKK